MPPPPAVALIAAIGAVMMIEPVPLPVIWDAVSPPGMAASIVSVPAGTESVTSTGAAPASGSVSTKPDNVLRTSSRMIVGWL